MSDFQRYNDSFNRTWDSLQRLDPVYKSGGLDRLECILDQLLTTKDWLRASKQLDSLNDRINFFPRKQA